MHTLLGRKTFTYNCMNARKSRWVAGLYIRLVAKPRSDRIYASNTHFNACVSHSRILYQSISGRNLSKDQLKGQLGSILNTRVETGSQLYNFLGLKLPATKKSIDLKK